MNPEWAKTFDLAILVLGLPAIAIFIGIFVWHSVLVIESKLRALTCLRAGSSSRAPTGPFGRLVLAGGDVPSHRLVLVGPAQA